MPAIVIVKSVVRSSSSSTSFPSTNQAIKTLLVSLKALVIVLLRIDLSSFESNQGQHIRMMTFTSKMQMHKKRPELKIFSNELIVCCELNKVLNSTIH